MPSTAPPDTAQPTACGLAAAPKDGKLRVPNSAFRLDAGTPFELAASDSEGRIPVKLAARSAKPINHWYWGQIIHDMAGFKADGARVPIDYDHWEPIGFANQFEADPKKGLAISGEIHTLAPGDTVDQLHKRSKLGTPYQASIFFAGEKFEYVERGETAECNGQQLKGPAVIVREWRLRGVAITLYGADHRTKTKFSDRDSGETEIALSACGLADQLSSNPPATMPTATPTEATPPNTQNLSAGAGTPPAATTPPAESTGSAPTELSATTPAAPPTPTREQFAAELKRYTDKFGSENGAKWFAEGKSYEQALELHATELQAKLSAAEAKGTELQQKLGQVNRGGEPTALSQTDAEQPAASKHTSELAAKVGTNLGAFAAGIKIPGAK